MRVNDTDCIKWFYTFTLHCELVTGRTQIKFVEKSFLLTIVLPVCKDGGRGSVGPAVTVCWVWGVCLYYHIYALMPHRLYENRLWYDIYRLFTCCSVITNACCIKSNRQVLQYYQWLFFKTTHWSACLNSIYGQHWHWFQVMYCRMQSVT